MNAKNIKLVKTGQDAWVIKVNGVEIGSVARTVLEEQVMIPGTMLRKAAFRKSTAYRVTLLRGAFVDMPSRVAHSQANLRSLTGVRYDVAETLTRFALKG